MTLNASSAEKHLPLTKYCLIFYPVVSIVCAGYALNKKTQLINLIMTLLSTFNSPFIQYFVSLADKSVQSDR